MLYPCEHYDKHKEVPGPTCPHDLLTIYGKVEEGEECEHWMNNYEEHDVFKPCREFTPEYRCDKTIDMFEGNDNGMD